MSDSNVIRVPFQWVSTAHGAMMMRVDGVDYVQLSELNSAKLRVAQLEAQMRTLRNELQCLAATMPA